MITEIDDLPNVELGVLNERSEHGLLEHHVGGGEEGLESQIHVEHLDVDIAHDVDELTAQHQRHVQRKQPDLLVGGNVEVLNLEDLLDQQRRHVAKGTQRDLAKDLQQVVPAIQIEDQPDVEGPFAIYQSIS